MAAVTPDTTQRKKVQKDELGCFRDLSLGPLGDLGVRARSHNPGDDVEGAGSAGVVVPGREAAAPSAQLDDASEREPTLV